MQIIKFKKIGKSKYKLCFENTELILHEDLILKYNLLSNRNLDSSQIEILLKENMFYDAYESALRLLSVKARTKKELETLLEKKNYDKSIIDKVILKVTEEGYINDNKYIELYVNDRVNLSTDGPIKIKNNLLKNELDINYIDKVLESISDDIWKEKIQKIINKKSKVNKNSTYAFKNKIINYLTNLGYEKNMIYEVLSNNNFNDNDNYKKELDKITKKYSKKYSGSELEFKIKKYMYSKGYSYERVSDNYEN